MSNSDELAQAIDEIEGVVSTALAFFRQAPDHPVAPAGPWRPKEVLAHICYWHTFTCESVERVLGGQEAQPPLGQVDEINARAVAALAAKPMATLADELEGLHGRMVEAMRALPDLGVVVVRRSDGSAFTAPERLGTMIRHIRSHLDELQRASA